MPSSESVAASLDKRLRVLHVGLWPDTGHVGGVDVASWPLLTAQVAEGTDVTLLVLERLEKISQAEAVGVGVGVTTARSQRLETLSSEGRAAIRRIHPEPSGPAQDHRSAWYCLIRCPPSSGN